MRLTVKERILLHLLEALEPQEAVEVSPERTQEGLARESSIDVRHVPQYIRPLVREGLVSETQAHVRGIRQRRKVYTLTDAGRLAAVRLRERVKAEVVPVRDASGERESTVAQILQEVGKAASVLEIARRSMGGEAVDLSSLRPAPGMSVAVPPAAASLESAYNWTEATKVYEATLVSPIARTPHARGELLEHLVNALERAAFQAPNPEAFRELLARAIRACQEAEEAYSKEASPMDDARTARCRATAECLRFWAATSMEERRRHLAEAWDFMRASLQGFETSGEAEEYGVTMNRLALVPVLESLAEWDARAVEPTVREAIAQGERAIRYLSGCPDKRQLARACTRTAGNLTYLALRLAGVEEREVLVRKALEYWRRGRELSADTVLLEPLAMLCFEGDGTDATLATCRRTLPLAGATRDRLVLAYALQSHAYNQYWKCLKTEDLDEWGGLLRGALEDAQAAKEHLDGIAFGNVLVGSFMGEGARAEYYHESTRRETDPRKKATLLATALTAAREGVERAEAFGFPDGIINAHAPLGDVLIALAEIEEDKEAKQRWLQEVVGEIDRMFWMLRQRTPAMSANIGDCTIARARARSELANLAGTTEEKVDLLRGAVEDAEKGLELFALGMQHFERLGDVSGYAYIAYYLTNIPDAYKRLHDLTGDNGYLQRATAMLDRLADFFRRTGHPSRVAECHWQAGRVREALEDYLEAADEFAAASTEYKNASERVPQLRDFYQDLALYMQAWNEIETARYHHAREEYGQARDCYERAASLHGFSRRWAFLADNYSAWMRLEAAEDLSRAEKGTEAISAFEQASELFRQVRSSLEAVVNGVQQSDERRMVEALIKAAERRRAYCTARVRLEEAKILDRHGEHAVGSRRYGEAALEFESLAAGSDSARDRGDLSLIGVFARAWEAMAKAEAETSPNLYADASRLFEVARAASSSERTKALAWGHSRFCLALEAGTRFADTRDPALYEAAITQLDSAAAHYARAGVESASEYSRASRFLFDAYAAMDRAGRETNPETRAKSYLAAERMLEASASAFGRAEQPGNRDQTRRLLNDVQRERELASSLMEVFRAPVIASSTTAIPAPTATYERAVGNERLGHADIHAETVLAGRTLALGEPFDLTVGVVNAGRAVGQLVAVEAIVPAGFEFVSGPTGCEAEGHDLSLKGRRLEPLRSEQFRIVLRPTAEGPSTFHPRLVYLDESGGRETCESEPIDVHVGRAPNADTTRRRTRAGSTRSH